MKSELTALTSERSPQEADSTPRAVVERFLAATRCWTWMGCSTRSRRTPVDCSQPFLRGTTGSQRQGHEPCVLREPSAHVEAL